MRSSSPAASHAAGSASSVPEPDAEARGGHAEEREQAGLIRHREVVGEKTAPRPRSRDGDRAADVLRPRRSARDARRRQAAGSARRRARCRVRPQPARAVLRALHHGSRSASASCPVCGGAGPRLRPRACPTPYSQFTARVPCSGSRITGMPASGSTNGGRRLSPIRWDLPGRDHHVAPDAQARRVEQAGDVRAFVREEVHDEIEGPAAERDRERAGSPRSATSVWRRAPWMRRPREADDAMPRAEQGPRGGSPMRPLPPASRMSRVASCVRAPDGAHDATP